MHLLVQCMPRPVVREGHHFCGRLQSQGWGLEAHGLGGCRVLRWWWGWVQCGVVGRAAPGGGRAGACTCPPHTAGVIPSIKMVWKVTHPPHPPDQPPCSRTVLTLYS